MNWLKKLFQKKPVTRSTGLIKQIHDSRDYVYRKSGITETSIDLRNKFPVVTQQDAYNSCAAHASCALLDYSLKYKKAFAEWTMDTSEAYLWYYARLTEGNQTQNAGVMLRNIFKTINKYGFISQEYWDYKDGITKQPNKWANTNAEINKLFIPQLPSYWSFTSTAKQLTTQIKNALSNNSPVVFGMPVDSAYMNLKKTNAYVRSIGSSLGNHAQLIVGYLTNAEGTFFIVRNSWGRTWGDNGYSYVSEEIIKTKGFDFWTLQ